MLIINVLENYTITITCYATHVETEQEHIARQQQRGIGREVQAPDGLDIPERKGSFGGACHSGKHMAEHVPVFREPGLHSPAVQRAQRAQVAGRGIALQPTRHQPCLVAFHHVRLQRLGGDVLALPETGKTPQRVDISARRALTAHLALPLRLAPDKAEKRQGRRQPLQGTPQVIGRTVRLRPFHPDHDGGHPFLFPLRHGADQAQPLPPLRRATDAHRRQFLTPFPGKDAIVRMQTPHRPPVGQLKVERSRLARYGRRPEFQFKCSHKIRI